MMEEWIRVHRVHFSVGYIPAAQFIKVDFKTTEER